jgi:NhaC family Na+:H+ antiporter
MSGVLGVSTASYFPYCFFNLLSPVLDVLYGFVGFKVPARSGAPATTRAPALPGPSA